MSANFNRLPQVGEKIELFEIISCDRYQESVRIPAGRVVPGISDGMTTWVPCPLNGIDSLILVNIEFQQYKVELRKVGSVTIKSLK